MPMNDIVSKKTSPIKSYFRKIKYIAKNLINNRHQEINCNPK